MASSNRTNPLENTALFKKVLGCLAIGAIGDNLGRPVENWHYERIDARYGRLEDPWANLEGGDSLAQRLRKFTKGTWAGFINQPTNVDINQKFVVFSVRDMEDELRPVAMYLIINYIWSAIRVEIKKRILVVDEAWWIMKNEDGASFLYGIAKRARKYYLGVATITQDVGDFLNSPYGKPHITNS